jgi:hypothetical protein
MFDLGAMPHRTLAGLRQKYGPVIWLRFGARNSMAILSVGAATEFFKNHDLSFAERTVTETMRAHDYHQGSLALAPYGPYWRVLRRLVTVDMLVAKRVNESTDIRRRCVDNMLLWIEEEARKLDAPSRNDGGRGGPGWAMVPPPNKEKKIEVKKIKKCKVWF